MKILKSFIAGFISFVVLQLLNIVYAILVNIISLENYKIKNFMLLIIISCLGVGIIGGLLSMIFFKIQKKIPMQNLYKKSGWFHAIFITLLTLPRLLTQNVFIHIIFTFFATFFAGMLSAYLYKKLTRDSGDSGMMKSLY